MSQEDQEKLDSVLQHVKTSRRAFLRRLMVGGAAAAAAAAAFVPLSNEVDAAKWYSRGDGKKAKGKGDTNKWFDRGDEGSIW